MMLGSLCLILGYQTLWLWAYANNSGKASGILPATKRSERILARMELERGLIVGGSAAVAWVLV